MAFDINELLSIIYGPSFDPRHAFNNRNAVRLGNIDRNREEVTGQEVENYLPCSNNSKYLTKDNTPVLTLKEAQDMALMINTGNGTETPENAWGAAYAQRESQDENPAVRQVLLPHHTLITYVDADGILLTAAALAETTPVLDPNNSATNSTPNHTARASGTSTLVRARNEPEYGTMSR